MDDQPILPEIVPIKTKQAVWSPTALAWMTVLCSPLVSGFMYALNWGRLGHPERKKRALWMVIAGGLLYCILIIRSALADEGSAAADFPPRALFMAVNLALAWQFYLGQQVPFKQYIQQGGRKASVYLPIGWGFALLLAVLGVAGGVYMVQATRDYAEIDRAVALVQQKKYKEAEPLLKELAVKQPDETAIYWNLAMIYIETDRYELAKQEVQKVLAHDPDDKDAKDFLKESEEMSKDSEEPLKD